SSFEAVPGKLWTGNLERKRYVCETVSGTLQATLKSIDKTVGDDFEANLDSGSPQRKFFTVVGDIAGTSVHSTRSIRPGVSLDDGLGVYNGTVTSLATGPTFATTVSASPTAFGMDPTTPPPDCLSRLQTNNANTCTERLVRW